MERVAFEPESFRSRSENPASKWALWPTKMARLHWFAFTACLTTAKSSPSAISSGTAPLSGLSGLSR